MRRYYFDRHWVLVGLIVGAGCSDLADSHFQGSPLFIMQGSIDSNFPKVPDANDTLIMGIAWHAYAGTSAVGVQQPAVISTGFPSDFELRVYEPPPEDKMVRSWPPLCDEVIQQELLTKAQAGQLDDPTWPLPSELALMRVIGYATDPMATLTKAANDLPYLKELDRLPTTLEALFLVAGCTDTLASLSTTPDTLPRHYDGVSFAIGNIWVFQDVNQDGKTTIELTQYASATADGILGSAFDNKLLYVPSSGLAPIIALQLLGDPPKPGYNLLQDVCVDGEIKQSVVDAQDIKAVVYSLSTEIDHTDACGNTE